MAPLLKFKESPEDYLLAFSNLALHLLQQRETVLPSLPVAVMLGSPGLPLIGHLSAAMEAEAKERRAMDRSVFMIVFSLEVNLVAKIPAIHVGILSLFTRYLICCK